MKKLAVLLIALFALASYGFSQTPDEDNSPERFGPKFKVMHDLNLNAEQQTKFNDIKYNHQKMMIDIKADMQKNRLEVKKMMDDNNINADKILKLTEANNNLHSKINTSRVNMWLDVYKILNKDQQEIWTKHFAAMGEKMREKFGERLHDRMERGEGFHKGPGMGHEFRDFNDDKQIPSRDGWGRK